MFITNVLKDFRILDLKASDYTLFQDYNYLELSLIKLLTVLNIHIMFEDFIPYCYWLETNPQRDRFSVALYATEERSPKIKNSTQTTLLHFNFSVTAELNDVTSRLIILINEEINVANCMVRNSAKLDRRTKQHTLFGVPTSDGSRDMARTKSWREKKEKRKKKNERSKPYSVPYGDR